MKRVLIAAAFAAAIPLAACSNSADSRYDRDSRTYDRSGVSGSTGSPLTNAPAGGVSAPNYGTSGQSMPQGQNMETNSERENRAGSGPASSGASPAYPASPGYGSGY